MKTVEEKAKEFLDKIGSNSLGSPMNAAYEGFLAGYQEAMRWRDPKEELPKEGVTVQVKIFNGHDNILEYVHDEYLGKNKWRKCTSKYIDIMGWRPIK